MPATPLLQTCVLVMCLAPAALLAALSAPALWRHRLRERTVGLCTRLALLTAVTAGGVAWIHTALAGDGATVVTFGTWFGVGGDRFAVDFAVDGWSLGFATTALGICGVVSAFSFRYLHREPGFHRYFVQLALLVLGITLVALAGSVEVLFVGWELLGLSSALLVGFFHERRAPVMNALRVFAVYRLSDAAMLAAAVWWHHETGGGRLPWLAAPAGGVPALSAAGGTTVGVCLVLAVAGKSALVPFAGWLPRAMEGPTPSSAVYYGALSVHAGCFLLLRAEPLLAQSHIALALAAAAGAATVVFAAVAGRVQSDVKSALAYATLTQVGCIVVEITLGWTTLAFWHILGHACFRLLQFLSAPNILHDLHELEDRLGSRVAAPADVRALGGPRADGAYLTALEQGFLDVRLDRWVVAPFRRVAGWLDRLDRRLCGGVPREPGTGR